MQAAGFTKQRNYLQISRAEKYLFILEGGEGCLCVVAVNLSSTFVAHAGGLPPYYLQISRAEKYLFILEGGEGCLCVGWGLISRSQRI